MATRINGKSLSIKFGATEFKTEIGSFFYRNAEKDGGYVTFADDAAGGSRQYFIEIESLTSTDAAALWMMLDDSTGDEVTVSFAPHGNTAGAAGEPVWTGTAIVGSPPDIGGAAGEEWNFEYRLDLVDRLVKDVTP